MAYMRGEWYVYATDGKNGIEYLQIYQNAGGKRLLMPMGVARELAVMLVAEMNEDELRCAAQGALELHGRNFGAEGLQMLTKSKTAMEALCEWGTARDAEAGLDTCEIIHLRVDDVQPQAAPDISAAVAETGDILVQMGPATVAKIPIDVIRRLAAQYPEPSGPEGAARPKAGGE